MKEYIHFTNQLPTCSYLYSNGSIYLQCNTYEAQSFTSLMVDLRQDRNRDTLLIRYLGTLMKYF